MFSRLLPLNFKKTDKQGNRNDLELGEESWHLISCQRVVLKCRCTHNIIKQLKMENFAKIINSYKGHG